MGRAMPGPTGRYEIKAKIAQGGMAEVFLAVQHGPSGFQRPVALKRILPHLTEQPGFLEMFLNEARIAATLAHPNICQIVELGIEDGRHFIAMEYLAGQSLARIYQRAAARQRPVRPAMGAWLVARAAEGLAHAHEKMDEHGKPLGIVHRDISPDNIIVTYDGVVKVVDFGIARSAWKPKTTRTGTVRGKLSYMSPEQVESKPVDARSDVFALGIVLYECLSGEALFSDDGDFKTMQNVLQKPVPTIAPHRGVKPALEAIARGALERNLATRLPSAREMSRRIDACLREEPSGPTSESVGVELKVLFPEEERRDVEALRAAVVTRTEPALQPPVGQSPPEPIHGTRVKPRPDRSRRWVAVVAATALATGVAGASIWRWARAPRGEPARVAEAPPPPAPPAIVPSAPASAAPEPLPVLDPLPSVALPKSTPGRRRHPATARPAPHEEPPEAAPPGFLTLETHPWTDVYLGDRKLGTTPLFKVSLPSGRQRLHVVNAEHGIDRTIEVVVPADQLVTLKEAW